jgi:dihydroorotate dehydrogenase electron transfer subunit
MTLHHRDQFVASVKANVPLCREHFRLVLKLPSFPETQAGQFVQVGCRDMEVCYSPEREFDWQEGASLDLGGKELLSPLAMLRRPFSLAGRRDAPDGVELDVIHRVVGVGTDWLSTLAPGDHVDILGPLGNRFTLPPADGLALLVGGGVGIPPMIYLAEAMAGRNAVVFSGALTRDLLPLHIDTTQGSPGGKSVEPMMNVGEFSRYNIPAVITTDDGSYGYVGFVTQALERFLDQRRPDSTGTIIYTCGPEGMMKRVAEIAATRNIECQIAVERAMACGMGTCQSCCIRVKKPDPAKPPLPGKDWCYRLACTDGPVFKGTDLLW